MVVYACLSGPSGADEATDESVQTPARPGMSVSPTRPVFGIFALIMSPG